MPCSPATAADDDKGWLGLTYGDWRKHADDKYRNTKLDFYAKVGSRELLVVDRDPWAVELYRLRGRKLVSVGRSDAANPAVLTSKVLPLTYQFRDGKPRPVIVVTHTGTGQTWTA